MAEHGDNDSHESSNHVSTQQNVPPVLKDSPSKLCMDAALPLPYPTTFPPFNRKPDPDFVQQPLGKSLQQACHRTEPRGPISHVRNRTPLSLPSENETVYVLNDP